MNEVHKHSFKIFSHSVYYCR